MLSKSAARVFFPIAQHELAAHFRVGVLACLYTFAKSGRPVGEVNPSATPEYA